MPSARTWTILLDLTGRVSKDVTDPAVITERRVRRLVNQLEPSDARALATYLIVTDARDRVRAVVREIEREAQAKTPPDTSHLYRGRFVHGSMSRSTGAVLHGCDCDRCLKAEAREKRIDTHFRLEMERVTQKFAEELKMEWTAEILEASFAIDTTGTTVRWGDATIDQHEARIGLLSSNASANLKAAARHQAAIKELERAGADCLFMLMREDLLTPSSER